MTQNGLRCHYCDWLVTKEIAEHILSGACPSPLSPPRRGSGSPGDGSRRVPAGGGHGPTLLLWKSSPRRRSAPHSRPAVPGSSGSGARRNPSGSGPESDTGRTTSATRSGGGWTDEGFVPGVPSEPPIRKPSHRPCSMQHFSGSGFTWHKWHTWQIQEHPVVAGSSGCRWIRRGSHSGIMRTQVPDDPRVPGGSTLPHALSGASRRSSRSVLCTPFCSHARCTTRI